MWHGVAAPASMSLLILWLLELPPGSFCIHILAFKEENTAPDPAEMRIVLASCRSAHSLHLYKHWADLHQGRQGVFSFCNSVFLPQMVPGRKRAFGENEAKISHETERGTNHCAYPMEKQAHFNTGQASSCEQLIRVQQMGM